MLSPVDVSNDVQKSFSYYVTYKAYSMAMHLDPIAIANSSNFSKLKNFSKIPSSFQVLSSHYFSFRYAMNSSGTASSSSLSWAAAESS